MLVRPCKQNISIYCSFLALPSQWNGYSSHPMKKLRTMFHSIYASSNPIAALKHTKDKFCQLLIIYSWAKWRIFKIKQLSNVNPRLQCLTADLVFCRHKCEKFHTFVNQSGSSKAGFGMTRIDYCLGSLLTHIYLFSSRFFNQNVFVGASSPLFLACLIAKPAETLVFSIPNIF